MTRSTEPPIIIVGAARSGTKALRSVLASLPDIAQVPFDVNFIWRTGNTRLDHDALAVGSVDAATRERIASSIARVAQGDGRILEKTVSNCLRVDFVNEVFPTARFIHLVRDPVDVVESVMRQWTAPADLRYLISKLKAVGSTASPRYLFGYLRSTVSRRIGHGGSSTWGPRYAGIDGDLAAHPLHIVCARQWRHCIEASLDGLGRLDPERVATVRFSDFVESPDTTLVTLADHVGRTLDPGAARRLTTGIHSETIGRGATALDPSIVAEINAEVRPALDRLSRPDPPAVERDA